MGGPTWSNAMRSSSHAMQKVVCMAIEVVSLPCLDQKMISPSSKAVARHSPSGDQSTARTRLECAVMVVVVFQVSVSQVRTVRSAPALASHGPTKPSIVPPGRQRCVLSLGVELIVGRRLVTVAKRGRGCRLAAPVRWRSHSALSGV